jgi:plastocyanin
MPDWQIQINSDPTRFDPSPRNALVGDNLYWTNNTDDDHQPWPLGSDGNLAPNGWGVPVIPSQQSSPSLPVPATTAGDINYGCKIHPLEEKGVITVLSAPPTF